MPNKRSGPIISRSGFTLMELVISGMIILVVSVTVYAVFAGGIGVWKRAYLNRNKGHALRLVIDKITGELRNTFQISSIPFEGTEESVSFASVVDGQVCRVSYFLDEDGNLCRRVQSYSDVFRDKDSSGKFYKLFPGVEELKLSYCFLDNANGDYDWKEDWVKEEQDSIPRAVKIEMTFEKDSGGEPEIVKTVLIPIGTGEQKKELTG
jgi:hypothetical protein